MRWALAVGRTPRELLASVTAADIVEMMAFEQLEPFGALAEDFRAGQIAATVANANRDPEKRSDPFMPSDFMPALAAAHERAAEGPILKSDPEAQSALLDRMLFGKVNS